MSNQREGASRKWGQYLAYIRCHVYSSFSLVTLCAGFQVPAGVSIAPPAPAGAAGGGATDAEEDGMPREDPSKLERAPGEEQEEVRNYFVLSGF